MNTRVSPSGSRTPTRKSAVAGSPGLFTLMATRSVVPVVSWPRLTATLTRSPAKVAVTVVGAVRLTGQGSAPLQPPPLSSRRTEPIAGVPVSVTVEPARKSVAQVAPQSIPAGMLTTVPLPDPAVTTTRVSRGPRPVKTYAAPACAAELSAWGPFTPVAALASQRAPITTVSPDTATLKPNWSPAAVLEALR